ncbi:MAG TPA: type VI secretion system baseplate subunit TssF [Rubrivivax sp.]|nr:type VI secretion system baseplate subunit TssF [Rubrivivax sp.]
MDTRLLRLYSDELTHLREMGAEFAEDFPKIAARLGLEGMEVADPYVERLLEGFAFLAARIQLKLDAEQPRLIAHLLESLYPNFLAPLPSMLIARLAVDVNDPNLAKGHVMPRASGVQSELPRGQDTRCHFRTAHAVTLWPVEVTEVRYFSYAPDLPLARLRPAQGMKGGLRIKLRAGGGLKMSQLSGMDRLAFYLSAPDDVAFRLHELILAAAIGTWVPGTEAQAAAQWRDSPDSIRALGFEDDQALLPESMRSFSGHRLVQEVAALPQRLLFFEVSDLGRRWAQVQGDEAEIVILFSRADAALEVLVDAGSVALHCTPAINLFPKRLDRIVLGPESWEFHAVPDRTKPMDFEVHSLLSVVGHGGGREPPRDFAPLYATHASSADEQAYYTLRREPRRKSARQQVQGTRSAYLGDEVFLSLVDGRHGPYRGDIRQLAVTALVTNRDLPTLLPLAGRGNTAWKLDTPGPVSEVEVLRGPTRPASRRPSGDLGWRLVSQLALNHLAISGDKPTESAASLRTALGLYGPLEDASWKRQVGGVRTLEARRVTRRLPFEGLLTFGTGIALTLELDDLAFQGMSAYLLGSVMERFFERHAAINSFTQMTLRTAQRGVVAVWPPRVGLREAV